MFKNIGKKIQGYSKLVFVIEVIFSLVVGALVSAALSSILYGDEGRIIANGALVVIAGMGIFFAWLSQMRLYAYGKIAESCEAMMKMMEHIEAMQTAQIPQKKCAQCGAVLDSDAVFCPECGTRCNG